MSGDSARKHADERLNVFARAVGEAWGFVPLSVRYEAARAADGFVEAWMDGASEQFKTAEVLHLESLLVAANVAFDDCTGSYAQELVAEEPWRSFHPDFPFDDEEASG